MARRLIPSSLIQSAIYGFVMVLDHTVERAKVERSELLLHLTGADRTNSCVTP